MKTAAIVVVLALAGCGDADSQRDATHPGADAPATPGLTDAPTDSGSEPVAALTDLQRPVFGGTLHIAADGHTAVVGDVQGDRVFIVDTVSAELRHTVTLAPGAIPFRGADADGTAYVSLRGTGQVAVIDLASGTLEDTWEACLEPRGMAVDGGDLQVACASGELVTFDRDTGARRSVRVDKDLRDIVVDGDTLWISRLRSAEVLQVARSGEILARQAPPIVRHERSFREADPFGSSVGWSLRPHPTAGVVLVHQRVFLPLVIIGEDEQGGYGEPDDPSCSSIVGASLTWFAPDSEPLAGRMIGATLVVDGDVLPDGSMLVAAAGASADAPDLVRIPASGFDGGSTGACAEEGAGELSGTSRATSVRVDADGRTVVLGRAPLTLRVDGQLVELGVTPDLADDGFNTFHADSGLGISCAGCHPEANDDGHTWNFDPIGPRRTQNVAVGLAGTEPFHWDGDMRDMSHLMVDVFVGRMGGESDSVTDTTSGSIIEWLDAQEPHRVSTDATADQIARGSDLYWSADVGCGDCHNGTSLTDSQSHAVGTGLRVQTPSLVAIGGRGPYMHDGCAPTLHDRFGECGGGDRHGTTSHLGPADIDALVAYLETL